MSNGETVFDYMDEGSLYVNDPYTADGIGIIDEKDMSYGTIEDRTDWRDFIAAYPPLIEDGEKVGSSLGSEIDYSARRSVLGYDADHIYLIAVEGRGMNFSELRDFCYNLGLLFAINLDGGGSTKMLHEGKSITSILYNRKVDNVVAIYLKKTPALPETVTLYRVQLGAFSKKANAERLQREVRSLPDTIGAGYRNAYIRYINGLYKVQVGAFSRRANAQRVVADLAERGYQAFINT